LYTEKKIFQMVKSLVDGQILLDGLIMAKMMKMYFDCLFNYQFLFI
jgi:hypothetical protein